MKKWHKIYYTAAEGEDAIIDTNIWAKKTGINSTLFWFHVKLEDLGNIKFYTVISEAKGEEQRVIDIMPGKLYLSE